MWCTLHNVEYTTQCGVHCVMWCTLRNVMYTAQCDLHCIICVVHCILCGVNATKYVVYVAVPKGYNLKLGQPRGHGEDLGPVGRLVQVPSHLGGWFCTGETVNKTTKYSTIHKCHYTTHDNSTDLLIRVWHPCRIPAHYIEVSSCRHPSPGVPLHLDTTLCSSV